jgi:hypothetical protein
MNYSTYYKRHCINNEVGLKPVYGATGLGKTYGIKECIKEVLNGLPNKKFVYITNRHALIQELYNDLTNEEYNIGTCYLKSNNEILRELDDAKMLMPILARLVKKDFFKFNTFLGNNGTEGLIQYFEAKTNAIKNYKEDLKKMNRGVNHSILEKEVEKIYVQIGRDLKEQFYRFKQHNLKSYQVPFLHDTDIWQLFPYIKFENDPNSNVLLGTIQKFCRGFFDGKKDIKLHDLKSSVEGDVFTIFLDEFDFLENEILNILSEEPQLQNSIEFVRIFMEVFEDWSEADFWDKDSDLTFVKERMKQTYEYLQSKINEHNFEFPRLRTFIFDDKTFKNGSKQSFVLFQNNRTVLSENFYLEQRKIGRKAFKIVNNQNENTVNTYAFFSMIKSATEQLLKTFDSVRDRHFTMEELIHQIWNTKNDNTKGEYHRYISENYTYRNIKKKKEESDFSYQSGFSLITIKKDKGIDPELAEVEQLELITSPESIIAQLASKNLVFALSATADIDRMVNSFNMNWFKDNVNFIEPSKDDIDLIGKIKDIKNDVRKSQVRFALNTPLDSSHSLSEVIKKLKDTGFYTDEKEYEKNKAKDSRAERSLRFFGCLDWIMNKSQNRTHLIFANSFKREILFFDSKPNEFNNSLSATFPDVCRNKLQKIGFEVQKMGIGYKLKFAGKTVNLIFLNADKNKELGDYLLKNKHYHPDYDSLFLDSEADKVILITQYATASNGLNLRCLKPSNKDEETDFEGVHLLEKRYFWFDTEQDTPEKALNNKKKAFWYYWKLYKKLEIGDFKFKQFLKKTDLAEFNSNYINNVKEHTLSQMALFYQALGRVDRKKIAMPPIEVTLGNDVSHIFIDYLQKPIYEEIVKGRDKYIATFISQLHDEILKSADKEQVRLEMVQSQDIAEENRKSRLAISSLLDEIKKINEGVIQDENALDVIRAWQELREYVLKQDKDAEIKFGTNTLKFKDLTFETALLQNDSKLFLLPFESRIYPKQFKDMNAWDLNNPFYYFTQNEYLKAKFENLNYATSFNRSPYNQQTIFTPYIEQAILRGAIGEECIKFLLAKNLLFCEHESELPMSLFELFDAKLQGKSIYLDFKNFSQNTQNLFELDEDDFLYDPDFSSQEFILKTQRKVKKIRQTTNTPDSKFVVINLISKQDNKTKLLDINLKEVSYFKDCAIAIVPSCITFESPNQMSNEFLKLIQALQNLNQ